MIDNLRTEVGFEMVEVIPAKRRGISLGGGFLNKLKVLLDGEKMNFLCDP